jgi:predicted ABC-type sugar transport system permease subunit
MSPRNPVSAPAAQAGRNRVSLRTAHRFDDEEVHMTVASQNMAPSGTDAPAVPAKPTKSRAETLARVRKVWPWAFLILMVAIFTIASQALNNVNFLSPRAVQGIAVYTTQILLLGLGETLIIICAGIDLSVAWILGFSSVVAAQIMKFLYAAHYGPIETVGLGILGGVLVAVLPGLLSGLLVVLAGTAGDSVPDGAMF